ncbi:PP-loop family protein [Talaromyces stipitatus ATCC 10500]|uniref:tRNA(Ile)-lysidine synthetase n=1 Tax=Talaromyces stipitatus (strain ATCC 10500 / CBS 375.48 / QM 6759 / NRRL 1006) TaxID=441959 RepID=B8LY20_TALSN|nr:PP-loop family protein [Talaromyces stipitatus ATCC 10500]EED23265.1 PP-loop family protein [Talaromyces stipitatus ATCC 10500]
MALPFKHGMSAPITAQQFFKSFREAWTNILPRYQRPPLNHIPRRIGIAVSGGPDSMALAYLCKQLQVTRPELELEMKAFVVDHKFREESTEEAHKVSSWLSNMDILSEVLTLDWEAGETPKKKMAFETLARTKRYQALGKACFKNQLNTLLIGHHLDDNVETGLLRMTPTAKLEGLAGIAPVARIPECHGLWGVSESGSFETIRGRQRSFEFDLDEGKLTHFSADDWSFTMATGGILLCRPLLPFYKASILETCREANVPYVTDPTNSDPTLTMRNTIRSLLESDKFPRALRPASMSAFLANNRVSLLDIMSETDKLLRDCQLLKFYPNSSTMEVIFPTLPVDSPDAQNIRILAAALRRITNLITPRPELKNQALRLYERFAQDIFTGQQRDDFTVAGVHFKLQESPNNKEGGVLFDNIWHISRTPFMTGQEPVLEIDNLSDEWSAPVLWDNRFWLQFRLHRESSDKPESGSAEAASSSDAAADKNISESYNPRITIRPVKKEDMIHISQYLKRIKKNFQFAKWAPRNSRFTLPVITTTTPLPTNPNKTIAMINRKRRKTGILKIQGDVPQERYIGLPTLYFMDMQSQEGDVGVKVQCRWWYKQVDAEALKLMSWLAEDHQEVAGYHAHY